MIKGDLAYWADQAFNIEKVRIAAQVRISHLAKRKQTSPETQNFLEMVQGVENFVDGYMSRSITGHPTWPWASRIKGIGKENFPKVIGLIEAFGHYYNVGDPMIPAYIKREPETYYLYDSEKDETVAKVGIFIKGIERLTMPSKLWKYAGQHVEDYEVVDGQVVGGHSPKRVRGKKLGFNEELRVALYRLGLVLIKQVRKDKETKEVLGKGVWRLRYESAYAEIENRCKERDIKIIPVPLGRLCPSCNICVDRKATYFCPDCGEKLAAKKEQEGYMYRGHLHNMAIREMIKDWLICLWIVWRQAEGLPVTQPYEVARLSHRPVDPWKMVDKFAAQPEEKLLDKVIARSHPWVVSNPEPVGSLH